MSGRKIKPENQALQDRICAVLADAWPEILTSAQIAERVGGKKTMWEICAKYSPTMAALRAERPDVSWCRAERDGWTGTGPDWNAKHHDGPVPQDSWERDWWAMDMNPHLNRLARDGQLQKIKVAALRGVLWKWAGDSDDEVAVELEAIWRSS